MRAKVQVAIKNFDIPAIELLTMRSESEFKEKIDAGRKQLAKKKNFLPLNYFRIISRANLFEFNHMPNICESKYKKFQENWAHRVKNKACL